jgi:hypothetical protein
VKTERMTILVTPDQKKAIAAKADALRLSVGEVVRRAVSDYEPDREDEVILEALASELSEAAGEARKALQEALAELKKTRASIIPSLRQAA